MKQGLHPQWYDDAVVTCECGNTFTTGSTQKEIKVEICSACHPFFTGEMRFVDTMGRVEKFKKQQEKASVIKKTTVKTKETQAEAVRPETLREMMVRESRKAKDSLSGTKAPLSGIKPSKN